MRPNDKILLENIGDYFNYKGLSPNMIDDIKENLREDLHKSEAKDEDYIEYRRKSPAEIILTIQRNLFGLQLNPILFFIVNFLLISYLYDKQFVPFQAATGLSIIYCLLVLPATVMIYFRIVKKNYLYSNRIEVLLGWMIIIIAAILVGLHAFNIDLGVFVVTKYAHIFVFFAGIIISIAGLYFKRLEFTGIGLLLTQKTIDAVIVNPNAAQIGTVIIWVLILAVIIYYSIRLSTRDK
ncbi:hypothetical protein CD149_02755 [Staphylococcus condimenti]|uniref:DUF1129 family protein n=2 Tax=Staphylococcus condimenti TaxID=70255 RepID=A0AB37H5W9_9STAP|nr:MULTISPECIES: hypothetical protein [Staphylococcus]AMY05581.1 hypothetical protein A4G25_06355 [Staphylococcus condimenti]APR61788.1 hypothetical protein BTZ13_11380 [Staphylococcus condimenti]MDK8645677.1 hypothetical protein [Staphylococcus condimenti]OFO99436.1 hypothetical protein HMPREF3007_06075 [Staphylococcus sp. HMSC065E08]PNZ62496.1 hypothetical protein CD149_02755 [Staphylococcus condimenti]